MSKLLVVVDYQNDFVNGSLGFEGAEKLDKGILERVREYLDAGEYVCVTFDTHDSTYLTSREGKVLPIEHCFPGSNGHRIYGETGAYVDELQSKVDSCVYRIHNLTGICKRTFGVDPLILSQYRDVHPDFTEVEFVGLVTNMCVISNVACFQAAYPNAQMIVDSSLVGSFDKELHEKALDVMRGMQVIVK